MTEAAARTGEARLGVSVLDRTRVVLGAFQRRRSAITALAEASSAAVVRRRTGGPAILAGPGTIHVVLALPRPDALGDGDAPRLANRHVRPMLRALSRLGAPARFGGRDFVAMGQAPIAWVGAAHRASTGASLFEAFVATGTSFALPDGWGPVFARGVRGGEGSPPRSLRGLGVELPADGVAELVREAYLAAWPGRVALDDDILDLPVDSDDRPPFEATEDVPIGLLGATAGPEGGFGGDLLASDEVVGALDEVARAPRNAGSIAQEIDRALSIDGAFLDGADVGAILRVLTRARERRDGGAVVLG